MLQVLCVAAVAAAAASRHANSQDTLAAFKTRWQPSLRTGAADASLANADAAMLSHCSLAVVGAGWGGAYAAWRLAVDTSTIDASKVCVFEANGRVGGRIYSLRGLPGFADLAVDVGGYRFQETQKLPADLVWNALKLATACYDWNCTAQCEGTTCYVIKDAYGNNAGYATGIEAMLTELEDAGAGRQVYFASRLTSLDAAPHVSQSASQLTFANGRSVTADKVVLNLPGNALEGLDQSSLIFGASNRTETLLDSVYTFGMNKVYAWYDDAWWNTKLKLMEGYFDQNKPLAYPAPLEGRYHDGPQRCVIGKDTAGVPVYSGSKVKGGNCSGALEVYYGRAQSYYQRLMSSLLQPLTVITQGQGEHEKAIDDVHAHLMAYHADQLKAVGVDPSKVPKPKTIVLSNWIPDGKYTPGIGSLWDGNKRATDEERKVVRKPLPSHEVYVVNQDYGYQSGWAVGSLTMAEKVLQAELGVPMPTWLDKKWYQANVVAKP